MHCPQCHANNPDQATACLECGECEPKCPQGIPIRERLKQTAAALGER